MLISKFGEIRQPISIALPCPNLLNIGRQSPTIECAFAKHLDFIIACVDCLQTVAHGIATSFTRLEIWVGQSCMTGWMLFASKQIPIHAKRSAHEVSGHCRITGTR